MKEGLKTLVLDGWESVRGVGGCPFQKCSYFSVRRDEGEFLHSSRRHVSHFMDVFTFPNVNKKCSYPMNQVVEICSSRNVNTSIFEMMANLRQQQI